MRRKTGLCSNAAVMIDSALKDVPMSDPIGGSASFLDSKVNIVKV
jgi:tetrathionate reductase subunit A